MTINDIGEGGQSLSQPTLSKYQQTSQENVVEDFETRSTTGHHIDRGLNDVQIQENHYQAAAEVDPPWSSLDDLLKVHPSTHLNTSEQIDAASIPLPKSAGTGLEGAFQGRRHQSYKRTIDEWSKHLPHLQNVRLRGRKMPAKLECYDFKDNAESSGPIHYTLKETTDSVTGQNPSLQQVVQEEPLLEVCLRLITVEDLSEEVMHILGSNLDMNPEVFEEHLLNSGWANGSYQDLDSDTWITRSLRKDYLSIKWCKPVKRELLRPNYAQDWSQLLDHSTQVLRWDEPVTQFTTSGPRKYNVQHHLSPMTNILRRDRGLTSSLESNSPNTTTLMWEERLTIWTKMYETYRLIIILLDPLPVLQTKSTGSALALDLLGLLPLHLRQSINEEALATADASTVPGALVRRKSIGAQRRSKMRGSSSSKWLDRARSLAKLLNHTERSHEMTSGQPVALSLRHPNTEDPEAGISAERSKKTAQTSSRPKKDNIFRRFLGGLNDTSAKQEARTKGLPAHDKHSATGQIDLPSSTRCYFSDMVPRQPYASTELVTNLDDMIDLVGSTHSTSECLARWILGNDRQKPPTCSTETPFLPLFYIVHHDTLNVILEVDLTLKRLRHLMLDDVLIQQKLVHWRTLLERFDAELQYISDTLVRFTDFISKPEFSRTLAGKNLNADSADALHQKCVAQISTMRQQCTKTHKSLMASMSIVESKRGIAEAESVTKLTELAFFYIPLTFSASIFSMQVKELNNSQLSLSTFFAVALLITGFSYGIRLFIRSSAVKAFYHQCQQDVRDHGKISAGSPIPTLSLLSWLWQSIGLLLLLICVMIAVFTAPIVILWTRHISSGFKVSVTVVLSFAVLFASYFIGVNMTYRENGKLNIRRGHSTGGAQNQRSREHKQPFKLRRTLTTLYSHMGSPRFLFWLAGTIICATIIAILWVRPLEKSIKLGSTLAILVIYLVILLVLAGRWIPPALRTNRREH